MSVGITAIYPGTFDPITLGHQDMVRRAACLFDRVIVAVAVGHHKKTMFPLDERMAMVRDAVLGEDAGIPDAENRIQVLPFEGLLRDFVRQNHGQVMVRGARGTSDFDYESQLAGMNRQLMPEVETICLFPREQFQFISSTLVREIATLGGEVDRWVTPHVGQQLALRLGRTHP